MSVVGSFMVVVLPGPSPGLPKGFTSVQCAALIVLIMDGLL